MPSTTSSSLSSPLPSSTVMTPSLPTLSIASAMILPISASAFAEMAPTCAISLLVVVGFESFFSSSTAAVTALSMPRFRSIGFMPAATYFMPSVTIDCASTVAVVVPSPALSDVLDATSLTIWAPMFSNLSFSSTSFATETPSFVTVGAPKLRSSTTLRPFGPRVTLTALARMLTPRTMRWRASSPKKTCFDAISKSSVDWFLGCWRSGDDAHQVFLAHHEEFVAVDLDRLTGVLAEQHAIADFDVDRDQLAVVIALAGPDRNDLALIGLLCSVVGDNDAGSGLALIVQALDDHAIVQGTNLHSHRLSIYKALIRNGNRSLVSDLLAGDSRPISTHQERVLIVGAGVGAFKRTLPNRAVSGSRRGVTYGNTDRACGATSPPRANARNSVI